ncbi:hypothetical protein AC579_3984 [Pseudocercospora musae]|uniref:AMP-binding enzyme C-terminal domain-containing protein n=1 Tax=Pseudocercospora musae TaxID=113226 RepID=A0A139H1Y7_9PEZI|nr:hypothetical protein AC579_3984 [Pseudocercospora musae]
MDQSERVFLFLQLKNKEKEIGQGLENRIKNAITKDLSRRHVPHLFFAVDQIPYNVNGKKLEIPLRAVLSKGGQGCLEEVHGGGEGGAEVLLAVSRGRERYIWTESEVLEAETYPPPENATKLRRQSWTTD